MENRILASFILYAVGDTIGFKNGDWEFNGNSMEKDEYGKFDVNMINELLYEFIDLGGINGINLSGWNVSDDTMLTIAVASGLLKDNSKMEYNDNVVINIKKKLVKYCDKMMEDEKNDKPRYAGVTTMKYVNIMKNDIKKDGRFVAYDEYSGGNGAAMRIAPVGLMYSGEKKRKTLITASIEISKLTHNSPHGFLSGLTLALFVAFGVENIKLEKWPFMLLDILVSDDVVRHINNNANEKTDYQEYINYWRKYTHTRFDDNGVKRVDNMHKNLVFRSRYYYNNFTKGTKSSKIGFSGYCAVIMCYDSLLDCGGYWEKLVVYSMLHTGDSDTVGSMAGFLYGLVYGFGDVPESNHKYLEYKDKLKKISEEFCKLML